MDFDDRTMKVLFFVFLIITAIFVIFTCIWKIVQLVATYKMETKIEELERLSGENNELILSPRDARSLRRLSILAGHGQKYCLPTQRRRSSSVKSGFQNLRSQLASFLAPPPSGDQEEYHQSETQKSSLDQGTCKIFDQRAQSISPQANLPNHSGHQILSAQVHHHPSRDRQVHPMHDNLDLESQLHQHHHHQVHPQRSHFHHHETSPPVSSSPPFQEHQTNVPCALHGHVFKIDPPSPEAPRQPILIPSSADKEPEHTESPIMSSSTSIEVPTCTPPPPLRLECANPFHVHEHHVHHCHCGASFPAVMMSLTPCRHGPFRRLHSKKKNFLGGSDPNFLDHHRVQQHRKHHHRYRSGFHGRHANNYAPNSESSSTAAHEQEDENDVESDDVMDEEDDRVTVLERAIRTRDEKPANHTSNIDLI